MKKLSLLFLILTYAFTAMGQNVQPIGTKYNTVQAQNNLQSIGWMAPGFFSDTPTVLTGIPTGAFVVRSHDSVVYCFNGKTASGVQHWVAVGRGVSSISINGGAAQTGNVTVIIPTIVSAFTNDAGYITAAQAPVLSVNGATGNVTILGSITKISPGANIGVSGLGTTASPYIITGTGGGGNGSDADSIRGAPVDTAGQLFNYALVYDTTGKAAGGPGKYKLKAISTTYAGLTDVQLTSLTNGQVSIYNSSLTKWVNTTPPWITTITGITAGGDLSGTYPNPVVNQLNGLPASYYLTYGNLTGAPTLRYQTVQASGTAQTQRPVLNFLSPLTVTDNPGNTSTDIGLTITPIGRVSPIDTLARVANGIQIIGGSLIPQTADSTHPGFISATLYSYLAAIYHGLIKDTIRVVPVGAGITTAYTSAAGDTLHPKNVFPSSTIGVSTNSDSSYSLASLLTGTGSMNISGASVSFLNDSSALTPYLVYGPSATGRKQWNSFFTYPLRSAHQRGLMDSLDYSLLYFAQTLKNLGTSGDDSLVSGSILGDSIYFIRKKFVQGNGILITRTGTVFGEDVYNFGFDTTYSAFQTYVANHAGGGGGSYTADETTLHLASTVFSIKSTYAGQTSITTLGTIVTGVWNGSVIATTYGGAPTGGTTGQVLTKNSNTSYDYSWSTLSGGGGSPATPDSAIQWNNNTAFGGTANFVYLPTVGGMKIYNNGTSTTTPIPGQGIWLVNTTAATNGVQEVSGSILWDAQGYATTPAASQDVQFYAQNIPTQGTTTAGETWTLFEKVNGGTAAAALQVTNQGIVTAGEFNSNTSVIAASLFQSGSTSYFTSGASGGSRLYLQKDSANAASFQDGTSAQDVRISNTFTAAGNQEYVGMGWQKVANQFTIGDYAYGASTVHPIVFATQVQVPTRSSHDSATNTANTLYVDRAIAQMVSSGQYTPTLTNTTNISASSVSASYYSKNGNIIHVMIVGNLTPTATASTTVLTFSLPIAGSGGSQGGGLGSWIANGGSLASPAGIALLGTTTTGQFTFFNSSAVLSSEPFVIEFDYTL